jgi:predicted DCC family thiol-disulfide oxidoreductase YuxK
VAIEEMDRLTLWVRLPRGMSPCLSLDETVMTHVTVWYDGSCPLCQREIALMRRLDRRGAIRFVDVADAQAICPVDRSALLARFHARENGTLYSGAAAFAAMWRAIPLLRPFGLLARNSFMLKLLDGLYAIFLKYRPRLQRLLVARASK